MVSSDGLFPNRIDLALRRQGVTRDIGLVVPSHMLVAGLVANSDLLGIVPDGLVERRADVAKFKLPFDLPGFDAGVVWHERSERDVGISGLRDGIKELVEMAITAAISDPATERADAGINVVLGHPKTDNWLCEPPRRVGPASLILLADVAVAQIVAIALNRRSASPLSRRERIVS